MTPNLPGRTTYSRGSVEVQPQPGATVSRNAPRSALVVGAGVVGLNVAYHLARRGVHVTVLDADRIGAGASHGNAGWINPAQTGPLPEPGLLRSAIRELGSSHSASQTAPTDYLRMLPWLAAFARHASRGRYERGARALAALGARTFPLLEQLADAGVEVDESRAGFLAVSRNKPAVHDFIRARIPFRDMGFGVSAEVLDQGKLHDLEPMLSSDARYGVAIDEHVQIDPAAFLAAMATYLRDGGVEFEEGVRALSLLPSNAGTAGVKSDRGDRTADTVVVATGAECQLVEHRLRVIGGRGYSFDVSVETPLTRSVLLLDSHVACSPLGRRLRIAGGMDFGRSASLTQSRLDSIAGGASEMLTGVDWTRMNNPWTGARPLAPDGLPIVDDVPGHPNTYIATGFSMLGMTLAAPAAEALVDLILTREKPPVLEPFCVERLLSRRTRRSSTFTTGEAP